MKTKKNNQIKPQKNNQIKPQKNNQIKLPNKFVSRDFFHRTKYILLNVSKHILL
jgi:hypothetical protein